MAGCVLFSQKPIYLRYVSKIAIFFVPEAHFCQGYQMGKASKSAFGLPVGSMKNVHVIFTQTGKVRKKKCDVLKQVHSYTQSLQIPWQIAKNMKIMW